MKTTINNKITSLITLCTNNNIEHDVIQLLDGKILDVIANKLMIYESERKFVNCRDMLDVGDHCKILKYAELKPINNSNYLNRGYSYEQ